MNAEQKERHEEARWLAQPQTPRDLETRAGRGEMLFQMTGKTCPKGRCAKPAGHVLACWPN